MEISPAEVCCACLGTNIHLTKTTDSDTNSMETLTKLRFCIPEVNWTRGYVCDHCLDTLNQSYLFKELCIRSNESAFLNDSQQILVKKEEISVDDESLEEANDYELKDYKNSVCDGDYDCDATDNKVSRRTDSPKDVKLQRNIEEEQLQHECNETGSTEDISIKKEELNDSSTAQKCKRNRSLTCDMCNDFTGAYKKLVEHVADVHKIDPTTITPYKCDLCDMKYKTSLDLYHHKIRHPGKPKTPQRRKVKCEICSKWFLRNTHLNSHIQRIHVDRNLWEYTCSYCDQKYPSKWDYERHLRHHTGEKPFACHLCDQKFILKSILQNHLTTHSDVRNFKCNYCDRKYKLKSTLKKHLKTIHNVEDPKEIF